MPQHAALEAPAQRGGRERPGEERRGSAGRSSKIGAEGGFRGGCPYEQRRKGQTVEESRPRKEVAFGQCHGDRGAGRDCAVRGELELLLRRHAIPQARARAALAGPRPRQFDGKVVAARLADDAEDTAGLGRNDAALGYSATSDDAIVRTVCRGTSPTAVTLRPRSVNENAFVLPAVEKPSCTSAFVAGASMKTETVARPSE